ncbi:hypothetical protein L596_020607 [Steinernema carpocapsae]|uniref:Uncharacterized protein n=1 Tax=Steinernema carpocapsae TaxID=34508 RepID=A0A4U5MU12_STECR|nr:hypothetical protein L596_020607 [Steinernema carpocapsae]
MRMLQGPFGETAEKSTKNIIFMCKDSHELIYGYFKIVELSHFNGVHLKRITVNSCHSGSGQIEAIRSALCGWYDHLYITDYYYEIFQKPVCDPYFCGRGVCCCEWPEEIDEPDYSIYYDEWEGQDIPDTHQLALKLRSFDINVLDQIFANPHAFISAKKITFQSESCADNLSKFLIQFLQQDREDDVTLEAHFKIDQTVLDKAVEAFLSDRIQICHFRGNEISAEQFTTLLRWNTSAAKFDNYEFECGMAGKTTPETFINGFVAQFDGVQAERRRWIGTTGDFDVELSISSDSCSFTSTRRKNSGDSVWLFKEGFGVNSVAVFLQDRKENIELRKKQNLAEEIPALLTWSPEKAKKDNYKFAATWYCGTRMDDNNGQKLVNGFVKQFDAIQSLNDDDKQHWIGTAGVFTVELCFSRPHDFSCIFTATRQNTTVSHSKVCTFIGNVVEEVVKAFLEDRFTNIALYNDKMKTEDLSALFSWDPEKAKKDAYEFYVNSDQIEKSMIQELVNGFTTKFHAKPKEYNDACLVGTAGRFNMEFEHGNSCIWFVATRQA